MNEASAAQSPGRLKLSRLEVRMDAVFAIVIVVRVRVRLGLMSVAQRGRFIRWSATFSRKNVWW